MQWIKVEESKPKPYLVVLVTDGELVGPAYFCHQWLGINGDDIYGWSEDLNLEHNIFTPTHWMPLPTPPKG
jgi:hypothetical protein